MKKEELLHTQYNKLIDDLVQRGELKEEITVAKGVKGNISRDGYGITRTKGDELELNIRYTIHERKKKRQ